MYLFFDTETNGIPRNYRAPHTDVDNWPRVIQLAWALYNEKEQIILKNVQLIKPNGWEIPNEKFWIENGFSQNENILNGMPIETELKYFLEAIGRCQYLIAHNMNFDLNIVACEMHRLGIIGNHKPKKICTMESTVEVCKIKSLNNRGFKWPKLSELHKFLFDGQDFVGAHDAMNDVNATAKCFFELKRKNLIEI